MANGEIYLEALGVVALSVCQPKIVHGTYS